MLGCTNDTPDQMLLNYMQLQDRPTAAPRQISNIRNWLENFPNAISTKEQAFLSLEGEMDLLTTRIRKYSLLGRLLERIGATNVVRSSASNAGDATRYFNHGAWATIGSFYLSFTTPWMLLLPLWFARLTVQPSAKLALVSAFTIGVCFMVTCCTTLKTIIRSTAVAWYAGSSFSNSLQLIWISAEMC